MAITFSGSQYLTNNSSAILGSMPISFSCWYMPASLATECGLIGIGNSATNTSYWSLQVESTGNGSVARAQQSSSGTVVLAASATGLTVGTWYHLVAVFASATSRTIYVNGVAASNATSNTPGAVSRAIIGGIWNSTSPTSLANGTIAYPCIHRLALSQADVNALYNSGSGKESRLIEAGSIRSFTLFPNGSSSPWSDETQQTAWTTVGSPTTAADPFNISSLVLPVGGKTSTPPMGWNSWRAFGNNASATNITTGSDKLVSLGLQSLGYNIVNPDGALYHTTVRDGSNNLQVNATNFPSGYGPVATHIQGNGQTVAVYAGPGPGAVGCSGNPGSQGFEAQDVAQWAGWGTGYLKYDSCFDFGLPMSTQYAYRAMAAAIQASTIPNCLLNTSCPQFADGTPFGANSVNWFNQVGSNEIYSSTNLAVTYANTMTELYQQISWAGLSAPGHWFQTDLLPVGTNSLTVAEGRSIFSIFCLMANPLWLSMDLTSITAGDLTTVSNTEAIAVNQDPNGLNGNRYSHVAQGAGFLDVWARQLSNGKWCVVLSNTDSATNNISATWSMFGQSGTFLVRDVWNHVDLGPMSSGISASVPTHSVAMFVLTPQQQQQSISIPGIGASLGVGRGYGYY